MHATLYQSVTNSFTGEVITHEDGEVGQVSTHLPRPRPAFFVLATRAEAEEHIVPHTMQADYCSYIFDLPSWRLEDSWACGPKWDHFSFIVPIQHSKDDPPGLIFRVFPFSGMNQVKWLPIGEPSTEFFYHPTGVEIPDIEVATLEALRQRLRDEGRWELDQ